MSRGILRAERWSRSAQISSDQPRSAQISSDQPRSVQISSDQLRSAQISSDQTRSAQIRPDQFRSAQISSDQLTSAQIISDQLRSAQIKRIAICFSSGDSGVVQTGASRLASQDGVGASQPRASAHEQCWKVHLQLPARSRQVLAHVHRRATDSWRSRVSAECFRLAFAHDADDEIDQPKKHVREITSGTAWHRRRRFSAC